MSRSHKKTRSKQSRPVKSRDFLWLALLVCAHLVLGAVYWAHTPFGLPPDEAPHANYVKVLADTGSPPVFDARDEANYEFHQPPLYYALGVPFLLMGRAFGLDEPLILIRLLSMILGALSICVTYLAVRTALPSMRPVWLGAAALVALLPTHVMIGSSISNDISTELTFGLALLVAAKIVVEGPTWRRAAAFGIVLGMGLLVKATCLLLFPLAAVVYIAAWRKGGVARTMFGHLALASVIGLAIGSWWLVRNQMLYGDILGTKALNAALAITVRPEYWFDKGLSAWSYAGLTIVHTFASFWAAFGHTQVWMPAWSYLILAALTVAVVTAACPAVRDAMRNGEASSWIAVVYASAMLLVALAFVQLNAGHFQAQGRYLYPALVPIAALWALGAHRLMPAGLRDRSFLASLAAGVFAQVVALWCCVLPGLGNL